MSYTTKTGVLQKPLSALCSSEHNYRPGPRTSAILASWVAKVKGRLPSQRDGLAARAGACHHVHEPAVHPRRQPRSYSSTSLPAMLVVSRLKLKRSPAGRALARLGEVRKQRHDENADEQCADDPKVHAPTFALFTRLVSHRPN